MRDLLWCACVALFCLARGEMFTSLAAMQSVLGTEGEIASTIHDYVKEEERRLAKLKQ